MKILLKLISGLAILATTAVAQAEVSGQLGMTSSHIRRGSEIGTDLTYFGGITYSAGGFSASASVLDTKGQSNDNDAILWNGDFSETQYELSYGFEVGAVNLTVGALDRTNVLCSCMGDMPFDIDEREYSLTAELSGVELSYVDGETNIFYDYDVTTLASNVGNTRVLVGKMTYDIWYWSMDYMFYEISSGTQLFGLDANLMYTGVFNSDSFEPRSKLVLTLSKSLSL
tara:strand:+ start:450 stop:1133 length:684 start_codon:yes stop_codon:yes gene_type:complete